MQETTIDRPSSQIFKDNAYKLHERGFSFVALNGKIPVTKNWEKGSREAISDMVLESMEVQYPNKNLGIVLGEQSGLIAVDYDAIEENKEVTDLIPRSIVERLGKKGFVRFYRYNGEASRKFRHLQIEIFSNGGQVVVPPSIHPETQKPYIWTSYKSIYDIDGPDDLDFLPSDLIEKLEQMEEVAKKNSKKKKSSKHDKSKLGRNNTLFEMCSSMVGCGVSRSTITEELISYDQRNHEVPWFSDPSEPHKGDVEKSVKQMIDRCAELDGNYCGKKPLLGPENFLKKTKNQKAQEKDLKAASKKINKRKVKKSQFPEPTGILKDMTDFCLKMSFIDRKKFSLAASCEFIGLILSNKVTFKNTSPCLYQLLIAESGEGKDVPLKFPKALLLRTFNYKHLGMSTYRGDKSVVKMFDNQLERIDTIDEISKLFKQMNAKSQSHLSSVGELLTEIWSSSNNFFEGFTTSEGTVGLCYSPCLSLFGATTPSAFSSSFGSSNIMQGFGARFLYFYEDKKIEPKDICEIEQDSEYVPSQLKMFITLWTNKEVKSEEFDISSMNLTNPDVSLKQMRKNSEKKALISKIKKPIPQKLSCSEGVEELLNEIYHEFNSLKYNVPETIKPLVLRAYQNMIKLTQIHWASRSFKAFQSDFDGVTEEDYYSVQSEDVLWAKQYVLASLHEASRLFDQTIIESRFHKESILIENFIKSKGGLVSKSDITIAFRRKFKSDELYGLKGIVPAMIENGLIEEVSESKDTAGRKPLKFRILNEEEED